jgi:hypothetical protein
LAQPDNPQVTPQSGAAGASAVAGPLGASDAIPLGSTLVRATIAFAVALVVGLLGYLAIVVPGKWFPSVSQVGFTARELVMSRGTATLEGDDLVVTAPVETGTALIVVSANLRSSDYPVVEWVARDVPADADVRLIWRTDYAPAKTNSAPVAVAYGGLLPVDLSRHPDWIGRVTGLGLAIRAPLAQPIRIRGAVAKPMGAAEVLADRFREWTAFEGWSGTSINTLSGGTDVQDLPLPALLFAAVALAGVALAGMARWRPHWYRASPAWTFAILFVFAWFLLDARWVVNLARQVPLTAGQYAGKDWRERHLAAEDGPLFGFVEKARGVMPAPPARVFVLADADYFRGRAAYHLYPYNVYYEPYRNATPPPERLMAGDWIFVYQRRGVQYDRAQELLRWDGGVPVHAELKLLDRGGALFRVK